MASFTDALKAEIARLVRKETKTEFERLRKLSASHRSEIAALKRDSKSLQSQLNVLAKTRPAPASPKASAAAAVSLKDPLATFGPQTLIDLRKKLGVTQESMALLLECSSLSVSRWEAAKAIPRRAQLTRIVEAMKLTTAGAAKALERIKLSRG